jgi:hypothetical protein
MDKTLIRYVELPEVNGNLVYISRSGANLKTMTLQEKMTVYKKNFEAKAPKEVLEIMHRPTRNQV